MFHRGSSHLLYMQAVLVPPPSLQNTMKVSDAQVRRELCHKRSLVSQMPKLDMQGVSLAPVSLQEGDKMNIFTGWSQGKRLVFFGPSFKKANWHLHHYKKLWV